MHVTILGCGYVGTQLARALLEAGHEVVGVRRSEPALDTLESPRATSIEADVTEPRSFKALPETDAIVFAASTGGRGAEAARSILLEGVRHAFDAVAHRPEPPGQFLFTSSTGVYGDHDGDVVDETTPIDPTTEKTQVFAEAERLVWELGTEFDIDATVVRFAGLYGPGRYRMDRYLEGPVTAGVLNMLHRDDAAGVLQFGLEADTSPEELLLAVDDEPVEKWQFARWLADACGEPEPPLQTQADRLEDGALSPAARRRIRAQKRCSNDRLHELGYTFAYPTYRAGYRDAIRSD